MTNLLFGWGFMAAFYVVFMRGYSSKDAARNAAFEFRHGQADRFGLLPPSKVPVGIALWSITALAFVAAIGFFLVGDRYIGVSSGVMIVAFGLTLWRDKKWLERQPGYEEAIATAEDHGPPE